MIWLVLIIAFVFRLININQSLWLDEAINVNNAANLDFSSLIFKYSLGDFHPPLYHLILKLWIGLFGTSEWVVRLPSVIFGVGVVYLTYAIAKKLFEEKTGVVAAFLMATAPLGIYYSQEARMYMLAGFLASLSVYFFINLTERENLWLWLGFIFSTTLMLYTDYLPYLLLPTYFIYLLKYHRKVGFLFKTFLPASILILIFLTPWALLFPAQLQVGLSAAAASPAWAQVVGAGDLKNLLLVFVKFTIGRISYDNKLIYGLLFVPIGLFFTVLFFLAFLRTINFRRVLVWYWFLIPIFMGWVISFWIPVFAYFRFVFVLAPFYIILAAGINIINWSLSQRALLVIALAINVICTSIYFITPKFQREDWRGVVAYVQSLADNKSIVLFESNFSFAPFDYYNHRIIEGRGVLSGFNADKNYIKQNLEKLTATKQKIFLFAYLSPITDPQGLVSQQLFNLGYVISEIKDFAGVGFVYEFVK